jgi:segregation and condensation protein B
MNEAEVPDEPEAAAETEAEAEVATEETPEVTSEVAEPMEIDPQHLRLLEAVLFTATEPLSEAAIADRLPDGMPVAAALAQLRDAYAGRGINVAVANGRWFMRTAEDLSEMLRVHMKVQRRLSRAAMETLAIIAYHQPVTRAEIEEIRGVGLSKGTLDALFESGWIGPKGRRRTAGRPVTWGTMPAFFTTFGIESIKDLPGLDDLRAAGLLDKRPAIQITDTQGPGDDEPEEEEADEALDMDLPDLDDDAGGETAEDPVPDPENSPRTND